LSLESAKIICHFHSIKWIKRATYISVPFLAHISLVVHHKHAMPCSQVAATMLILIMPCWNTQSIFKWAPNQKIFSKTSRIFAYMHWKWIYARNLSEMSI